MKPSAGTEIAPGLRLVSPIGAGAMGSVWSARDERLDRVVAVKFIGAGVASVSTIAARFRREAELLAKLKSPHVVQVYSHGLVDETPYIVMELLEGRTLSEEIGAKGRLAPAQAAEILDQLARGLGAAHQAGVVHRDVKPANVFLVDVAGYDVFVKLVDFGIARQTRDEEEDMKLTSTGAVLGTPLYMSPEQLLGRGEPDARTDLWALAVVAYEMLTGLLPFQGSSPGALAVAMDRGVFPPPSEVVPALGARFDPWFLRALAHDPERRFASAAELARSFRALVATGDLATAETIEQAPLDLQTPDAPRPPSAARSGARVSRLWPAIALAAIGGGGILYGALHKEDAVEPPTPTASAATTEAPSSVGAETASAPVSSATARDPSPAGPRGRYRGRLAPQVIQGTIQDKFPAIHACHSATKGAVIRTVTFTIEPSGQTRDVEVWERDADHAALDQCLIEKFAALRFPAPEGGSVPVAYPLAFGDGSPNDAPDCASTLACAEDGRCTTRDGDCVAGADNDCTLARVCLESGECKAVKGQCVARYDDCGGEACSTFGRCTADDGATRGPQRTCRATRDADCERAAVCRRFGLCSALRGACRATSDERCANTDACLIWGRCAASMQQCFAASDAGCAASANCRDHGACSVHARRCAAKQDADCRGSRLCADYGACAAGPKGRCVVGSTADCKASKGCREHGECILRDGACAVP